MSRSPHKIKVVSERTFEWMPITTKAFGHGKVYELQYKGYCVARVWLCHEDPEAFCAWAFVKIGNARGHRYSNYPSKLENKPKTAEEAIKLVEHWFQRHAARHADQGYVEII